MENVKIERHNDAKNAVKGKKEENEEIGDRTPRKTPREKKCLACVCERVRRKKLNKTQTREESVQRTKK